MRTHADPAAALLTPEAVRERCGKVFDLALSGRTKHFDVDLARLDVAAGLVVSEIRRNYPRGNVPLHSRWRHFELNGRDLWAEILAHHQPMAPDALARARIDLAVISVLLDAGAGADWHYNDAPTELAIGRSEGLALASLRMFEAGLLSSTPNEDPLRVDQEKLENLKPEALAHAFQATPQNALPGIDLRTRLLNNLGRALAAAPSVFAGNGSVRPGHIYDYLKSRSDAGGTVPARLILITLLEHLGAAWPGARRFGDVMIADAGDFPLLELAGAADGIVPFHKLSQWLSYSLIEPLQEAGLTISNLDDLTGLAEYRNGGLFIDTRVLVLKDRSALDRAHDATSELIVEWRALTVALLDRLAVRVREMTGTDATSLPLGAVLQGGTWSAGRRIAADLRPGGPPPLTITTDGTLF